MSESAAEKLINFKKIPFNNYLLLFILAVAAVLRFWKFQEMQFMHDELSALIRSQADSFSELIYKTKTTDVHPVGVPVFIHYWSAMVGRSEIMIRLPFILFGLLSVYYSYKIAEKWFNPTVAIYTAACLATLQFPTMYGQLARPYATGMLFSVMMAWCWTQFFFGAKNKQNRYAAGFVVFAALCAYTHYFSMLFAAIVGATGLLFLNKENFKKYLLMCLAVLLLFIPHVSILLFHLFNGAGEEVNWLGKPQPDWLLTFLKYLFHYSAPVYLLVAALFLAGFYFGRKEIKAKNKMRLIALVWALLGPALAYFYSIYKTPVLQFSSFTFSLPFLLIFLFSFYTELKKPIKGLVVGAIVLVNTYTLFANRKHYPLFYKHSYEQMAIMSNRAIAGFGEKNVFIAHSVMEDFVDQYFEKHGKFSYLNADGSDIQKFVKQLQAVNTDYFVAGNFSPEFIQVVKEKYPYIIAKEEGFTYSVYCFSKNKPQQEVKEKIIFSESQQKDAGSARWEKNFVSQEYPSNPVEICMKLDSTQEYSVGFSAKLSDIIPSKHCIINVRAEMGVLNESSNPTIVMAIDNAKESLLWRGSGYQTFKMEDGVLNNVFLAFDFSGMDLRKHPDATIKIYIWNRDKKAVWIKNLSVDVIESNPVIYGLYEPIE